VGFESSTPGFTSHASAGQRLYAPRRMGLDRPV